MPTNREWSSVHCFVWLALACGLLALGASPTAAAGFSAPDGAQAEGLRQLKSAASSDARLSYAPHSGRVRFLGLRPGHGIPTGPLLAEGTPPTAESRARAFVARYGAAFGLRSDSDLVVLRASTPPGSRISSVRFRQQHHGIPVTGAQLIVHLQDSQVTSAVSSVVAERDLQPVPVAATVPADKALHVARALIERIASDETPRLQLNAPHLEVFFRGVLGDTPAPGRLAWLVEAHTPMRRELIWVDARSGVVLLHFNQQPRARNRVVFDAQNSDVIPATPARSEGDPAAGQSDVDLAYDYSGDTYDHFASRYGWDSYDGMGATLVSHVRYCPSVYDCPWSNAWWDGTEMQYGEGFASADDVVAHELTHAVTEHTAGLYYYKMSGALNESFSDVFGEAIDLMNGAGSDSPSVRWLMGEDLPGGALRHMLDPGLFGDPSKTSDPLFVCENGMMKDIVHSDSAILNHAFALMTDGGSFNGRTVSGIGLDKSSRVAFRVLSEYLTPASGFYETYDGFQQACADLVGSSGITAADCTQVDEALMAVEMTSGWPCAVQVPPPPPMCPTGAVDLSFQSGFEDGGAGWDPIVVSGGGGWYLDSFWPSEGEVHAYGDIYYLPGEVRLEMTSDIVVPVERTHFRFDHYFELGDNDAFKLAGAVVEYSLDGGGTWQDAESLVSGGATYNGTITGNGPLQGRRAFAGQIPGYTVTELSLASLAGQSVRFRFRLAGDGDPSVQNRWWLIDNVRAYSCSGAAPLPGITIADNSLLEDNVGTSNIAFTVRLSAPSAQTVTVDYATADGTAEAASDYAEQHGTVTFPPNITEQTVAIAINGDTLVEQDETFLVLLTNPSGAEIDLGAAHGTILNDDLPPLTVSVADVAVAESDAEATFSVQLSRISSTDLTVSFGTQEGTATAGDDFEMQSGVLVFHPGETLQTVTVPILDDDHLDAAIETFSLVLTDPSQGTLARDRAECRISDNELHPQAAALVKDIYPGLGDSDPSNLKDIDGVLYFSADDGTHGATLWRSDGTEAGTTMVADIDPANTAGDCGPGECPSAMGRTGTGIVFSARHTDYGREMWVTDGTQAGTHLLKDINPSGDGVSPSARFAQFGQRVVFAADDGVRGTEPWITDGTPGGTQLLREINPGRQSVQLGRFASDGPWLYFTVTSVPVGLWRTDGMAPGTTIVKGFVSIDSPVTPILTPQGKRFVVAASDGVTGRELWISDGTPAGTTLIKDIFPGADSAIPTASFLQSLGEIVMFLADDGVHGRQLWRSDGTEAGTFLVSAICAPDNNYCYDSLMATGNTLYFSADDGVHGRELWRSDGSPEGTWLVKDIRPGSLPGVDEVFPFGAAAGSVLLKGFDGSTGEELWRSDGTEDGTTLLADINPGPSSSTPYKFTPSGSHVFFSTAYGPDPYGDELWAVQLPTVRPSALSLAEGATPHVIELGVTLLNPTDQAVSVAFATEDGSAHAGSDYEATSGTLVFPVGGATVQSIPISIIGDSVGESPETFAVVLSGARNAVVSPEQVDITILDDDNLAISIGNAQTTEGSDGTTTMTIAVTVAP